MTRKVGTSNSGVLHRLGARYSIGEAYLHLPPPCCMDYGWSARWIGGNVPAPDCTRHDNVVALQGVYSDRGAKVQDALAMVPTEIEHLSASLRCRASRYAFPSLRNPRINDGFNQSSPSKLLTPPVPFSFRVGDGLRRKCTTSRQNSRSR